MKYKDNGGRDEENGSRASAKCIGFFLEFRQSVVNSFGVIFDKSHEGNENAIATESFAEKWSWFGVFYRLAGGQIVNLETITKLNLFEALTWLSYETDLDSQNKVKHGSS